jgi:hypothetical protein
MNNNILILIIFIASIIFWLILSSILKIWPFHKDVKVSKSQSITNRKRSKNRLNDMSVDADNSNSISPTIGIIIFVLFMLLMVFLGYVALRTNITRYQIAGDAIKSGNSGIAVAALSPDIGSGINNLFRS